MTKKHYEAIAKILKWHIESATPNHAGLREWERTETGRQYSISIARQLSDYLAQDNPRFNRARFLQACGVQEESQT